jgi:hypothetical protein
MSKKEMDDFIMFVFLVEQELACEIVYAPHYLKFEHSIIWNTRSYGLINGHRDHRSGSYIVV